MIFSSKLHEKIFKGDSNRTYHPIPETLHKFSNSRLDEFVFNRLSLTI